MQQFITLLKDNLTSALKSKKALVFLALYLILFSLVINGIKEFQQEFFAELAIQQATTPELMPLFFEVMGRFSTNSGEFIGALFTIPPYSLQLFAVTLFGTPILLLMVHYDKLAQEISDGTYRYLLFRTSRAKIYWAKWGSAVLEITLVTFLATLFAVVYGHFSLSFFQTGEIFAASMRFWLAGLPFLIAFSSLVLMFSVMVRRPFTALLLSASAVVISALLLIWVPDISPFYWENWKGFFLPGTPLMIKSILIYLGYAALFSSIGFAVFRWRDL